MLSVMEVRCVQGFNDYEVIGRSMGTVSISSDVAVLVLYARRRWLADQANEALLCFALPIRLCL